MSHQEAKIADIIRSSRRDESFIEELQSYLTSVLKLFGINNHHRFKKFLTPVTTSWYYLLTSLSNLQTLGEEYTGTLRLDEKNKLPNSNIKLLWFILYIGGEAIYEKVLNVLEKSASDSNELTSDSKVKILRCVKFLKVNKILLMRLHHSIFCITGKYYNVSNRIAGIKYVLLRQPVQEDTTTKSFNVLGIVSVMYVLFALMQKFFSENISGAATNVSFTNSSGKMCVLCAENRKNTCATLCGHLFCWDCIQDSLKYQPTCPICREDINPSRIVYLQNYV